MLKKKIFKLLTVSMCIMTLIMPHANIVLAAALTNEDNNSVNEIELMNLDMHEGGQDSTGQTSSKYDNTPYMYEFNDGQNYATTIPKFVRKDDRDSSGMYLYSDAFYCLDGNDRFPSFAEDGKTLTTNSVTYTRAIKDFFNGNKDNINMCSGSTDEEKTKNYNSLCWLLSSLYLKKQMSQSERKTQKDAIFKEAFKDILNSRQYEDDMSLEDIEGTVTDDDIEVIQQWAIWYFTNYGEKSVQGVAFTNDGITLPSTIDLTSIDLSNLSNPEGKTDSLYDKTGADKSLTPGTRQELVNTLYKYLVNEAKNHNTTASSGTKKYPELVNRNINCETDGENYKIGPFKVSEPSNVSSSDYDIKLTDGRNEITSGYSIKDKDGKDISKKINEIFDEEFYVYMPISTTTISKVQLELSYSDYGTKASVWNAKNETGYQPIVLLTKESSLGSSVASATIVKPNYDLALRKYIVGINDDNITDRNPNVGSGTSTTASYKHKKEPVEVSNGDIIKYKFTVYNEGETTAKEVTITDYLPEGLELVNDTYASQYTVKSVNGNIQISMVTNIAPGENESITVRCKVSDDAASGAILTNIAEITSDDGDDRDSHTGSIDTSKIDLNNYTGSSKNKSDLSDSDYFYKGQDYVDDFEDDDDFEKVKVKGKAFDLNLQKFITKVNGKNVNPSREPDVDTTPLKNGSTNADYKTVKTPVRVQIGDIVTYKIRVYNEGEADGYANKIVDYLPAGLGYLVNYKENNNNSWTIDGGDKMKLNQFMNYDRNVSADDFENITDLDNAEIIKGGTITSTKLNSSNSSNLIKAFDGGNSLSYKDVEVTCIVLSEESLDNIAEIKEHANKNGKTDIDDRDSTPGTVDPNNYPGNDKNQDDHDKETLEIRKIDLSLQKFITKVNGKDVNPSREPVVNTEPLKNGSTNADYETVKTPISVREGDIVTYKIRVYNEGDIDGYAKEVVDYLPAGLGYLEGYNANKENSWSDSSNESSEIKLSSIKNASKNIDVKDFDGIDDIDDIIVIKTSKIMSNKLDSNNSSNLIKAYDGGDSLSYKDIEVTCVVLSDEGLDNIAEIYEHADEDGNTGVEDRDSTPRTVDPNNYPGGDKDQDDHDKESLEMKKIDLSLKKFITTVNGQAVDPNREPVVDTTPLKNGSTNANYETVKTPVIVKEGDIVTYKIRVYNEGEVSGYAESVADYIPRGLGFLVSHNTNIDNYWRVSQGAATELETVKLNEISNATKNVKLEDFSGVSNLDDVDVILGNQTTKYSDMEKDEGMWLTSEALSSNNSDNLIKAYDGGDKLDYRDIEVVCVVLDNDEDLTNYTEIMAQSDEDKNEAEDRDSEPNNNRPWGDDSQDIPNYNDDDWDYDPLAIENKTFDLALQKFISGVNDKSITDREPQASYSDGKITYTHPQTPLEVNSGDNITYTIRVYNEGQVDGYVAEIMDDLPSGLKFDPNNEINKAYGWKMIDSSGNETTDVSKAVEIRTDYLSKEKSEERNENTLLKALDIETGRLEYLDVKVVFTVDITSSDATITNIAEITKNTDEDGNYIPDIDSEPNNKKDGEDDLDKERIHLGYFDLALKKDLTKAIITDGNSNSEIPAVNGQLMKVEIHRKKINSTIVRFEYNITVTNEGTIPGYAKEIKDYIPAGLQFVEADNTNWKAGADGSITSGALADKLLQPGEKASVPVVLRWINGENNLGLKTNVAEISADFNEANDVDDIDSTPNNKKDGEDDIDSAPVLLSISTGRAPLYIVLTTGVLAIIGAGVSMIKKYALF